MDSESERRAGPDGAEGIAFVALSALPGSFERVAEWVAVIAEDLPGLIGARVLFDLRALHDELPSIGYLEQLAEVLFPLLQNATDVRCALLVALQPHLWRARFFESITSRGRVQFRAFTAKADAIAWLSENECPPPAA